MTLPDWLFVPELPEVETIRRMLAPLVEGRPLARLEIHDPRWCRPLPPQAFVDAAQGRTVQRLGRRGKYLIWELSGDVHLLCHLRMTGTLVVRADRPPHTRVTFGLDGGPLLQWVDPRRFGTGELALGLPARDAFLAQRLGVEPFDAAFTGAYLRALSRRSRAPIKAFLLDQTKVAGVGNIYADEALFRAKIHPLRPANRLTAAQCAALRDTVVEALSAGIAAKGASIDDFRDPYGVAGAFQDQFLVHLREGQRCPDCGTAIVKLRAAGRGTYVCETCQPKPRAVRRRTPAAPAARPGRPARAP